MDRDAARAVSATLFNNAKFIDVILAIEGFGRPTFTTQEIANQVNVNHDLARKVIDRLERLDLVKRGSRLGGARSALPFELQRGPVWDALVTLVVTVRERTG